jgi:hypothetical protein
MTNYRRNFVPGDDGFRKSSTHPTGYGLGAPG